MEIDELRKGNLIGEPQKFGSDDLVIDGLSTEGKGDTKVVKLDVTGMSCASCVQTITKELTSHPDVIRCDIALLAQRAVVEYKIKNTVGAPLTDQKVADMIDSLGFEASVISANEVDSVDINLSGFSSLNFDPRDLEASLRKLDGISDVRIDLSGRSKVKVVYNGSKVGIRDIVGQIESLGISADFDDGIAFDSHRDTISRERELREWSKRTKVAAKHAIPIMVLTMLIPHLNNDTLNRIFSFHVLPGVPLQNFLLLILCVSMHLTAGRIFYKKAYASYVINVYTMDTLIVLGSATSLIFSIISVLVSGLFTGVQGEVFFETSAMLIMFISMGRYIENLSKKQTSSKLTELMVLFPSKTILLQPKTDKIFELNSIIKEKMNGHHMGTFGVRPIELEQSPETDISQFPFDLYDEKVLETKYIQYGDYLKVAPGEKIPTDSIIIGGESSLDESVVTGESLPIHKTVGDYIIGGTINGNSPLVIVAVNVGKNTTVAQMIKLVFDAQMSKASIQGLADSISSVFVSTVLILGLLTFVSWMIVGYGLDWIPGTFPNGTSPLYVALSMTISVVVVSCPCALSLATPTAIMVGTGVAAKNGIIVKGGDSLEKIGKVTKIVFDKTGTLTTGKIKVSERHHFPPSGQSDTHPFFLNEPGLWNAVSTAQSFSEHPIGAAVANALYTFKNKDVLIGRVEPDDLECTTPGKIGPNEFRTCKVRNYRSVVGCGILAEVSPPDDFVEEGDNSSSVLLVGNRVFALSYDGKSSPMSKPGFEEEIKEVDRIYGSRHGTIIYVILDRMIRGVMLVGDSPKPESASVVSYLKYLGMQVAMITGDQAAAATEIADSLGISEVYPATTPAGKQALIKRFKNEGSVVAMVGDGLNDSASLAYADLGIAVNSATGVSMEASDMVLMRQDLSGVIVAIDLSAHIIKRIKVNFAWAFIYNVLMIPLASGIGAPLNITLPTIAASLAMPLSSISVIVSSLFLNLYKPPVIQTSNPEPEVFERDTIPRGYSLAHGIESKLGDLVNYFNSRYMRYRYHSKAILKDKKNVLFYMDPSSI